MDISSIFAAIAADAERGDIIFRRTRTSPCASSACSTTRIAPSTRSAS